MYLIFLVYFSVDCFHVLAVVNSTAVNTEVYAAF